MTTNYNKDYCKELLLNSGGSVTRTINGIDIDATPEQIKDTVLHNHSNLKTPSQKLYAHIFIQQMQTTFSSYFCRLLFSI